MNISFERVSSLEYLLKAVRAEIRAFQLGEKYVQMKKESRKALRAKDRRIQKLEAELAQAHSELITVRNQWFAVYEDMEKEHAKMRKASEKEKEQLKQRALKAESTKSRHQLLYRFYCRHHRKFWIILILKRNQRQSPNSSLIYG